MALGNFAVVRSTVKYVLNSSGVLESVAVNTPAFEFNADGTHKGLLVEPAGTNFSTTSNAFSVETAPVATVVQNQVDPFGNPNSAWLLMDATSNSDSASANNVRKIVSGLSSNTYTTSLWVKSPDCSEVTFQMLLTTNAVIPTFTISGNSWFSVSVTSNTAVTSTRNMFSTIGGVPIIIYGHQVEVGSVATSYIPTVGSTVTRGADNITLASASSLIGQTQGTLYVEIEWRSAGTANQGIFYLSIGANTNKIAIYRSGIANELRMLVVANSVAQTNQGASSIAYSGIIKVAFAYAHNDCALYKDGASISTDTVVDFSALSTLTDIDIGQDENSTIQANMWIRSVTLFPTRLSNAQLATLTTL